MPIYSGRTSDDNSAIAMLLASLLLVLVQYSTHSNAVGLMAASHRPRVYVLPDDAGYVRGASRLTLGPPVRRSAFLYATHTLQADMGAPIVPVLYDAIAEHYAAPAWTADLFFAFVPLPYYPPPDVDLGQGSLLPSFTSQWCAHVRNATRRLKSVYEHAAAARKEKGEPVPSSLIGNRATQPSATQPSASMNATQPHRECPCGIS